MRSFLFSVRHVVVAIGLTAVALSNVASAGTVTPAGVPFQASYAGTAAFTSVASPRPRQAGSGSACKGVSCGWPMSTRV